MKKVLLFEDYLNENSVWKKANKKAEDLFGELGIASLDDSQLADIIDIEAADKLADKMFGEFGFLSLSEEDMEKLLTKNPKLLKESVNEGKGWAKLMKAVRSGSKSGPWSIVSIEGGKVVNQELVKIMDLIPAKYEDVKKRFPNAKMSIEDNEGMQVYNESVVNESDAYTISRMANDVGLGRAEDFLDKYNVDLELLANAVRRGSISKYELRDIINGDVNSSKMKQFVKTYVNEAIVNEAKFKVGDTWEWKTSNGIKIVKITNIKPNGDVIGREDGTSQDFIVRDADKFLKKKVN